MSRHVLLNNVDHHDLRVITRHAAEFGHAVHAVPVFVTELADIQREYPILFRKDRVSGTFQLVALLGFVEGENLFLHDGRWHASYVPGFVARGPFLIGFQQREVDGELREEPVIHVDLDDARVGGAEGEHVFLPHGGNSPYLERIAAVLRGIQEGVAAGKAMIPAFEQHGLLEPVDIRIELYRDNDITLKGFHTISEHALARLDGSSLEVLNRAGFLQGAFLIAASLNNIHRMAEMKKTRMALARR